MHTEGENGIVAVNAFRDAHHTHGTAGLQRGTENENEIVVVSALWTTPRTRVAAGPRAGLGVRGRARPSGTKVTKNRDILPPKEAKVLVNLLAGARTLYRPTFLVRYPKPMVFSHQSPSPQGTR